jgi:spore germination protein KB
MNKEISYRQISFMYLFISLSPIIRQIPKALAGEAGQIAYISPLWSILVLVPLTAIVIVLLSAFPGFHIYEIMVQLAGKFLAKILILGYFLWILLSITLEASLFTLTLQYTLMPQTQSGFILAVLVLLVFYGLYRGIKTVFRFSEFALFSILFLFCILFLCAISKIRMDYLLPVSVTSLPNTVLAAKNVAAVGGNIMMALFFADKSGFLLKRENKRVLWYGMSVLLILASAVTFFTIGVTGAGLASDLPFPFYITVKSISFFNIFERFEVLFTVICMLSDFVATAILAFLLLRCFCWAFGVEEKRYYCVPFAMIVYYLTFYLSQTQFEVDYLYRNIILYLNLLFQYLIPIFLVALYFVKRKKIKKQF